MELPVQLELPGLRVNKALQVLLAQLDLKAQLALKELPVLLVQLDQLVPRV